MQLEFLHTLGQDGAKQFLTEAMLNNRFPHALLIYGSFGVGQNALALDMIDILLCDSAVKKPCHQCQWCLERKHRNQDNVTYLFPLGSKVEEKESDKIEEENIKCAALEENAYLFASTAKENISIAQIRDMQNKLGFAELADRKRIAVIVGAETLQAPAANALLKILEEPPPQVFFLLTCEDRQKILPTILSRCTQISLPTLKDEELAQMLPALQKLPGETLQARFIPFAEGSIGQFLLLHREGGEALQEAAKHFIATTVIPDWRAFSEFIESSEYFTEMESSLKLLQFILRSIRQTHRAHILNTHVTSPSTFALDWEGLDELMKDNRLQYYVKFIESVMAAIQAYSKPTIAALGSLLEYEAKIA